MQKLKIEQPDPHPKKLGVNSCVPEGSTASAPLVIPVVLLLNDTNITDLCYSYPSIGVLLRFPLFQELICFSFKTLIV